MKLTRGCIIILKGNNSDTCKQGQIQLLMFWGFGGFFKNMNHNLKRPKKKKEKKKIPHIRITINRLFLYNRLSDEELV